ncbi:Uncharacterised protein r2_g1096 [Pycnogonum litorale]
MPLFFFGHWNYFGSRVTVARVGSRCHIRKEARRAKLDQNTESGRIEDITQQDTEMNRDWTRPVDNWTLVKCKDVSISFMLRRWFNMGAVTLDLIQVVKFVSKF